jgi:TRAP-type uncharacterized transport system substrate-binding protein
VENISNTDKEEVAEIVEKSETEKLEEVKETMTVEAVENISNTEKEEVVEIVEKSETEKLEEVKETMTPEAVENISNTEKEEVVEIVEKTEPEKLEEVKETMTLEAAENILNTEKEKVVEIAQKDEPKEVEKIKEPIIVEEETVVKSEPVEAEETNSSILDAIKKLVGVSEEKEKEEVVVATFEKSDTNEEKVSVASTEPEKIKSINFEPKDMKTINEKYIESKLINDINPTRILTKESSSIDILDNIIYSQDKSFEDLNITDYVQKKYELNILNVKSIGSKDVINKLQDSSINIGLTRGDILGIHNNGLYGFNQFKNYGILCSPSSSVLYIVSKIKIDSIYDLRGKRISTGNISNFAQVYLSDMLQNSGLSTDISFRSYSFDKSINLIKSDKIDMIFMFSKPKDFQKLQKHNLVISSIPKDAFQFLKRNKGLNPYNYKVGDKIINTLSAPNYIVAPLETLDIDISKKIEAIVDKFECYKNIQNIDPFYGAIHPEVKDAISRIRVRNKAADELNNKLNSIVIKLDDTKVVDNQTQYVYRVYNDSKYDANITFDHYRTKLFDNTAIKARHVLDNFPKGNINIKPFKSKLVSFTYENRFTTKVKDTKINLIFKDLVNDGNIISTVLRIGDN